MITNKHVNKLIIVLVSLAVITCILFRVYVTKEGSISSQGVELGYENDIFNTEVISEVNIIMEEEQWQDMLDNAIAEEYYKCDVIINGTRINNVGIRPKGNTSLSSIASDPTTDRYSFKIEFDKYVKGQTYKGLDKLVLNNNYADATNMKEAIVYDMYQFLDADASLYNYAKISVNDKYVGVYFALEAVEDSFLLRNYGVSNGNLYKPDSMDMGGGNGDRNFIPDMNFNSDDINTIKKQIENGEFQGFRGGREGDGADNTGDLRAESKQGVIGTTEQRSALQIPNYSGQTMDGSKVDTTIGNNNRNNMVNGFGKGGMSGNGANLNYTDDSLDSYSTIWEGEVNDTKESDHKRIVEALKNIHSNTELEEYLDVDNVLKYMAVHTFSVNMDSLSGNMAHNYYIYEADGKLNILPWDYNLSFGGMNQGMGNIGGRDNPFGQSERINSDNKSIDNDETTDDTGTELINFPNDTPFQSTQFFDVLLENTEYLEIYHSYLEQLVNEYVDGGRFDKVYNRIRTQIDELVSTDPTAFYTFDEYNTAAEVFYNTILLRGESILEQLNGMIPSTTKGQEENPSLLLDGSAIDVTVMGQMNMGGGGRSIGQSTSESADRNTENPNSIAPNMGEGSEGFTPPNMGEGSEGFTPPSMGEGSEGFTPPNMGEGSEGFTPPNMGEGSEGFTPPNMGEGNRTSSTIISGNINRKDIILIYGITAVCAIFGLIFASKYGKSRRRNKSNRR